MIVLSARALRAVSTVLAVASAALLPTGVAHAQLDLRAVLDSVASTHPTVLAGRARVRAALGGRQTAGQFGNPVFAYEVDGAPFPGQHLNGVDRETMTMLTVPLEPLYQRRPRIAQANAQVRAAQADAASAIQMVSLDATRAFYRAARAQVRVELTRDVVNWLDTVVAYNRARVNEGVAAEADLIRSQVEREKTAAELSTERADLIRAKAELSVFVNDGATVIPASLSVPSYALPLPATPDARPVASVQDSALRPDLRASQERVSVATAGIAMERTNLLRQVGATFGTKQMMGATTMLAGFSVPLPVFDRNRGEISRATAERDAAMFDYAAVARSAGAQVVGAREAARLLTEQASALTSSADTGFLARAEEAKRIALGAYREGAVPLYQVIDATRVWSDARMAYFDLLFAQHQSVLDLLFALGRDLRLGLPTSALQSR